MNNPSRSSNVPSRSRKPVRPLPALPSSEEKGKNLPQLSHLVKDDIHEPFRLLDSHPLNLICQYHNVKRVSLEEGVPPPFKFDVPLRRDAIENTNALLPTHVLAVYDQDLASEQSSLSLSPHSASSSSGRPSLPATPLLIPVNADLWALHFATTLSPEIPSPLSVPRQDTMYRRSRADSVASDASPMTSRNGPAHRRPRSVLSLPVQVVRVPSAKALPLLLLSSLRIIPHNHVLPALLPRKVLAELPAPPAILAQHLLQWLYPTHGGRERMSLDLAIGVGGGGLGGGTYSPFFRTSTIPSISRSPRLPPSPLLSPSSSSRPDSDAQKRFSSTSASSLFSTGSSISSLGSTSSSTEPTCALADPTTLDDPDLRLLLLAQQNFGLWANALALGVRDPGVVRLVELAWSVASEARRVRFGIGERPNTPTPAPAHGYAPTPTSDGLHDIDIDNAHDEGMSTDVGGRSYHSSLRGRQTQRRNRAPIPFLDAPPKSS